MENRDEVHIQATPEEVWDVLTDMGMHSEWNPLIYQAEGIIEPGNLVKLSARTAERDMKFSCSIVRVEPYREFQWDWHVVFPFILKGEHIFRIEPIDEDTIRFINREIFNGILVPFMRREFETSSKDAMVAMDRALKERVEQLKKTI